MNIFTIIVVLISASMHAGWNVLCKSHRPSGAFFLMATTASITAFLPVTIFCSPLWREIPPPVWICLIFTGLAQTLYYISLGNAYRLCEVSLAYPLARALPVLFVPTLLIIFGSGNKITSPALLGMGLVALGCASIPMNTQPKQIFSEIFSKGYLFIVLAALGTTGYTIIDNYALHTLAKTSTTFSAVKIKTSLMYITLENISIMVFLLIYVLSQKAERATLQKMITERIWQPLLAGVICSCSYVMILLAMMFATNVSYITAFRQVSIPLGAILGIVLFKEKFTASKVIGITLLCTGLVIVALY